MPPPPPPPPPPPLVFDMDYGRLVEVILEFEACELRRCLNVFINNDLIPEDMESFLVILGETPGLSGRITLEPTEAEIAIIDANSKLDVKFTLLCIFLCFLQPKLIFSVCNAL